MIAQFVSNETNKRRMEELGEIEKRRLQQKNLIRELGI